MLQLIAIASITVAAALAQASVQPDGTFIPSQCGQVQQQELNSYVKAVCVGRIAGEAGRAVQFHMAEEVTSTFKVVNQSNMMVALLSGNTKSNFFLQGTNGETATMKAILSHDGTVQAVSGQINGADYFVPKMEVVFTIQ
jgi:hypothetical protein